MTELIYNSSVNRTTQHNPFEIVIGMLPRKRINLVPLPTKARPSAEAEDFAKYIHDIYTKMFEGELRQMKITRHMQI